MSNPREIWSVPVGEQNSAQWIGTLVGADGTTAILLSEVVSITLSVQLMSTGAAVNSVTDIDILNTGRGTFHATSGLLTIDFDRNDMSLVDTTASQEKHVAVVKCTYGAGGAKGLTREIEHTVKNLAGIS